MKLYTEAELIEIEKSPYTDVCELTAYIRQYVGTVEVRPFSPWPDAIQRSIRRHKRKEMRGLKALSAGGGA